MRKKTRLAGLTSHHIMNVLIDAHSECDRKATQTGQDICHASVRMVENKMRSRSATLSKRGK